MRFSGPDYELRWPHALFRSALTDLVNNRQLEDWQNRAELLLVDAFRGSAPLDEFRRQEPRFGTIDDRHKYLVQLLRATDELPQLTERTAYWSERRTGVEPGTVTIEATVRAYVRVVDELLGSGYFDYSFGKDCVDDPSDINPAELIESALGIPGIWPLSVTRLTADQDIFYSVIEVLHDLAARPRNRYMHSYAGCGWHYSDFAIGEGQTLYRWRVNRLLERADLGVRLADDGEDVGRLVTITDDARTDLARTMLARRSSESVDRVRHALALFRKRGTTEHDKRSAVVTLALVLEERRKLLKTELLSKDEGALFQIANNFSIRHQNDSQQSDYRPEFLDWVFWWYLATIELTDRLYERDAN